MLLRSKREKKGGGLGGVRKMEREATKVLFCPTGTRELLHERWREEGREIQAGGEGGTGGRGGEGGGGEGPIGD